MKYLLIIFLMVLLSAAYADEKPTNPFQFSFLHTISEPNWSVSYYCHLGVVYFSKNSVLYSNSESLEVLWNASNDTPYKCQEFMNLVESELPPYHAKLRTWEKENPQKKKAPHYRN